MKSSAKAMLKQLLAARITRLSPPLAIDELTFPEIPRQQAGYHVGVCGRSYHPDGSGQRGGSELGDLLEKHGLRTFEQRFNHVRTGSDIAAATQAAGFLEQKPAVKPIRLWVNFSDPPSRLECPG